MKGHIRTAAVAVVLVGALAATSAACSSGPPDPSVPLVSAPAAASPANSADVTVPPLSTAGSSSRSTAIRTTSPASRSARSSAKPTAPRVTSTVAAGSGGALKITKADVTAATVAVAKMTPEQVAGSVLMVTSVDLLGADGPTDQQVGGAILGGSGGVLDGTGVGTPDQVSALTAKLQQGRPRGTPKLLIGTDQEYGDVTRLVNGFTAFPGASQLAAIPDTDQAVALTRTIASAAAQEMLAVGVTVDFAPDADVLPADGSESAIGDRSYGSDPERTALLSTAAVVGYQRGGVAATLKHFPGIGRIAADTHESLPTLVTDCAGWNATEAVPMRSGIRAGVALVMTGHVLMPAVGATTVPASLSPNVVTDLLKGAGRDGCEGMGFDGIAVTDSLLMQPVLDASPKPGGAEVQALLAGEDLLLMSTDPAAAVDAITAAVADGTLPRERLTDAAVRVYALRLALDRIKRPPMSVIASPAHQELADQAAQLAGTG